MGLELIKNSKKFKPSTCMIVFWWHFLTLVLIPLLCYVIHWLFTKHLLLESRNTSTNRKKEEIENYKLQGSALKLWERKVFVCLVFFVLFCLFWKWITTCICNLKRILFDTKSIQLIGYVTLFLLYCSKEMVKMSKLICMNVICE